MPVATATIDSTSDKTFAPKVGSIRTHPVHGPVRVMETVTRKVRGESKKYIDLEVIGQDMRIAIPAGQGNEVGLRDLIDEKQIASVLAMLAEPAPERPARESWAHRQKSLGMQVQSGVLKERISAIREILTKAEGGAPSSLAERSLLDSALSPLAAEIAIARKISREEARALLVDAAWPGAGEAVDAEETAAKA